MQRMFLTMRSFCKVRWVTRSGIAALHGRMKQAEKDEIMGAFAKNEIQGPGVDNSYRGWYQCAECYGDHGGEC